MTTDSTTMPTITDTDATAVITGAGNRATDKRIGKDGRTRKLVATTITTSAIDAWAAKITTAWCKSVQPIFETGDLLIAAKKEIGHGEWIKMCKTKLPFKIRTAQRLMLIADTKWHADPDSILISNAVAELCAGKELRLQSVGRVALKGFDEPLHVHRVEILFA